MKLLSLFLLTVVALAGCSSQRAGSSESEIDKLSCQKQIRSAAYCVIEYRSDHEGQFPKTLEQAVNTQAGKEMAKTLTQCPSKNAKADYAYVDWSRWFTNAEVPKDYPLVYELTMGGARRGNKRGANGWGSFVG
jgi:hypothetical protein